MKKIYVLAILIMILVTLYSISNTYAKYYSEAYAQIEQTVGKWVVKLNDVNIASGEEIEEFEINELNFVTSDNVIDGKIAPGRVGYADIIIDATESSVAVKYDITLENSELEVNKMLKLSKVTVLVGDTERDDIIKRTGVNTYTGIVELDTIKDNEINTARIYLEWENDITGENNELDTFLGKNKGMQISIPITVKATQYMGEKIERYS